MSEPTPEYGAPWLPVYDDEEYAQMVQDMRAEARQEHYDEMGPEDFDGDAWRNRWGPNRPA